MFFCEASASARLASLSAFVLSFANCPTIFITSGGGGGCGTFIASLVSVAPSASSIRLMSHS